MIKKFILLCSLVLLSCITTANAAAAVTFDIGPAIENVIGMLSWFLPLLIVFKAMTMKGKNNLFVSFGNACKSRRWEGFLINVSVILVFILVGLFALAMLKNMI